jgi:hypothetical protein
MRQRRLRRVVRRLRWRMFEMFRRPRKEAKIPILEVVNQEDRRIELLIEPHLELYHLEKAAEAVLYYDYRPDNSVPEKTLSVAYQGGQIVVYAPGPLAPKVYIEGELAEPSIY